MTNIQMILALGAMILLTILITNVNKNSLNTEDVMYDSNFGITATSIASSVIEDASKKRFDNIFYVDSSTVYDPTNFTPAADLGVETGEVITDAKTFNDFDDYDGFTGVDSTMPSAIFNYSCTVNYVNENNLDAIKIHKLIIKKLRLKFGASQ